MHQFEHFKALINLFSNFKGGLFFARMTKNVCFLALKAILILKFFFYLFWVSFSVIYLNHRSLENVDGTPIYPSGGTKIPAATIAHLPFLFRESILGSNNIKLSKGPVVEPVEIWRGFASSIDIEIRDN